MLDRTLRIGVGAVALSMVFVGPETLWGLLGLIPLATGIAGWCPLYAALGLDTRRKASAA